MPKNQTTPTRKQTIKMTLTDSGRILFVYEAQDHLVVITKTPIPMGGQFGITRYENVKLDVTTHSLEELPVETYNIPYDHEDAISFPNKQFRYLRSVAGKDGKTHQEEAELPPVSDTKTYRCIFKNNNTIESELANIQAFNLHGKIHHEMYSLFYQSIIDSKSTHYTNVYDLYIANYNPEKQVDRLNGMSASDFTPVDNAVYSALRELKNALKQKRELYTSQRDFVGANACRKLQAQYGIDKLKLNMANPLGNHSLFTNNNNMSTPVIDVDTSEQTAKKLRVSQSLKK